MSLDDEEDEDEDEDEELVVASVLLDDGVVVWPEVCVAATCVPSTGSAPALTRTHSSARTTRKMARLVPITATQPGRRRMRCGAVLMGTRSAHVLGVRWVLPGDVLGSREN
jgi:hypothetical protein